MKHAPVYEDELSLRFTDQDVLSTFHLSGIEFHFSTRDHKGLIGFTIVDPFRYNIKRKTRKNRFEWSKRFFQTIVSLH
ncbi:hypothetical protein [Bacillus safensis]|uniref:hypothetical protein n=1 Tax=Bacillus safensis TaxID=561879 RepID=UPI001E30661C|nr:hypothetical protein [Bacillus safensis]